MKSTPLGDDWNTSVFPEHLCTIASKNHKEEGVFYAPPDVVFLCIVVNTECPREAGLQMLRPHTATKLPEEPGPETLYGWSDLHGNLVDHKERAIWLDQNRVVAWTRVSADLDLRLLWRDTIGWTDPE